MPRPSDCRLGSIWKPNVVASTQKQAKCGSRIVEVDNRVVVANGRESTLRFPMGNATKAWDDSGTARGVGADPTLGEPPLFILDEAVDNVGIAMRPLAQGDV